MWCWPSPGTVTYNFGGNWSALFCTGAIQGYPAAPEFAGTYVFAKSYGYDGQQYRYVAHDPLFHKGFSRAIDAPRLRYRRILVPGLAHLAALGRPGWIDTAYRVVALGFIFLGGWWASRFAVLHGAHAAWGLGFVLAPGALISIDRLTVDVALAALCCGWALHAAEARLTAPHWALLAAAALARETGVLLAAATSAAFALRGKWRDAFLSAAAAAPLAAWWVFVLVHTPPYPARWFSAVPLQGFLARVFSAPPYAANLRLRPAVIALDYVALAGVALAFALGAWIGWKQRRTAFGLALLLFVLLGSQLSVPDVWVNVYGFARVLTPLILLLALAALEQRRVLAALPLALLIPRVGVEFSTQLFGLLGRVWPL